MMKRLRLPTTLLLLIGLLVAGMVTYGGAGPVAAQDPDPAPTVRFVHVYSGGGPVDVYLDDTVVAEQLEFGIATEYTVVPDGEQRIRVVAAGEGPESALIDTTFSPETGSAYNVLIGGQDENLDARVHEVDLDAIGPGEARIRFIQASPDGGDVDFTLAAPATTDAATESGQVTDPQTAVDDTDMGFESNVAYGDVGDYQTVRAATYDIVVRQADTDTVLIDSPNMSLEAGTVYDVVVLGRIDTDNLTLLPLMTPVSPPCSELLAVGEATDACVRFVHTSADAGEVDILVDGAVLVQAIGYGTATEFTALQGGEHQIQVVQTGQSAENAVLDTTMDFRAGQAYQFAVLGIAGDDNDGNDLRLNDSEIDLTPLPVGQARVRVIHAVADTGDLDVTFLAGDPLFDGMSFDDATQYAVIDAGTYDIDVTASENVLLVSGPGTEIAEGMAYDLFVIGRAADNSAQILILSANAMPRIGDQGTPVAVAATPEAEASPVGAGEATAVGGDDSATPVGAPATPVLTDEATATP